MISIAPKSPKDRRDAEGLRAASLRLWLVLAALMAALPIVAPYLFMEGSGLGFGLEESLAQGARWLVPFAALACATVACLLPRVADQREWRPFAWSLLAVGFVRLFSSVESRTVAVELLLTGCLFTTWLAGSSRTKAGRWSWRLAVPAFVLVSGNVLSWLDPVLRLAPSPTVEMAFMLLPLGTYLLFALILGPEMLRLKRGLVSMATLLALPALCAAHASAIVSTDASPLTSAVRDATEALAYLMLSAAILTEVAGRAAGERELARRTERSAARTEALLETVADGIILLTRTGRVHSINRAARQVFGYRLEEVYMHDVAVLIPSLGKGSDTELEDGQRHEGTGQRRDGSVFPVSIVSKELVHSGSQSKAWIISDLTDLKRAEQERDRFFSLSPIAMFVGELGGSFLRVNRAFHDILGFKPKELNDRTFIELVHPEDRAVTMEALARLRSGRSVWNFENRLRASSGAVRWFSWSFGFAEADERIYAVGKEVTERKRMESELHAAWRYSRDLFDLNPSPIVVLDCHGVVQDANEAACEMLGPKEQSVGAELAMRFDKPQDVRAALATVHREGNLENQPLTFVDSRGELAQIRMHACRYADRTSEGEGVVAVLRDVTKEKMLEAQLLQAQKLESIGQLAAGIAHEINTPTQYVMDNVGFLEDAVLELSSFVATFNKLAAQEAAEEDVIARLTEALREADADYLLEEIPLAIEQANQGLDRVAQIVRAMKEFSHPGQADQTDVDVNHAIRNTVTVTHNALKYVADLTLDLDPHLPPVPCNENELNQVILNLLINAGQAIEENPARDVDDRGCIVVRTLAKGSQAEIQICDNGPGIPEEIRSRIFDLFFTTKEVGKGTGQGLALARSVIVEKHGGELTFESSPQGTTFFIRLPLSEAVRAAS